MPPLSPDLLIDPEPALWRSALGARRSGTLAERFRYQLGLPTDTPIVMSGHQPTFWHAGILAKWLAIVHAAAATKAHPVWLVVDQDAVHPQRVRVPVAEASGALTIRDADLTGPIPTPGDVPACLLPAARAVAWKPEARAGQSPRISPGVSRGLATIGDALNRFAKEPNAARQVARAAAELCRSLLPEGAPRPTLIFATDLAKTDLWRDMLERMRKDPEACARAYNEALRAAPESRLRPFLVREDETQLPLWAFTRERRRAGVVALDFKAGGRVPIAPKALLTTLMVRLLGCDLFVHGTGGGGEHGYDRATDAWARLWLGKHATLAPVATASATMRLDFGPVPSEPGAASRALWLAQHARHDPASVGDEALSRRKAEALAAIAAAPRHSAQRLDAYRHLHAILAQHREAHARELASLRDRAQAARSHAASDAVRLDRTFAFPLHDPESLGGLSEEIAKRF